MDRLVECLVMVRHYITHVRQQASYRLSNLRALGRSVAPTPAAGFELGFTAGRVAGVGVAVAVVTLLIASDPVAAQEGPTDEDICGNDLMTFIDGATKAITFIAPVIGFANAGVNFSKAAGTNKPQTKKEAKENIRSSIMYGIAGGFLSAIVGLILTFGPMSTCDGLF